MNINNDVMVSSIIVTYNPEISLLKKLIFRLNNQVEKIIIVDNLSDNINEINKMAKQIDKVDLIELEENRGLAEAQNIGIIKAKSECPDYLILFDQDSVPSSDLISKLVTAYVDLKQSGLNVGAVGPIFIDSRNNFNYFADENFSSVNNAIKTDFLIASGCIFSPELIDDIGLMTEDLFVYHIDRDWCHKIKYKGYEMFVIKNAIMQQTIGERTIKFWFFKWFNASVHSPLAHYYTIRNSFYLFKQGYVPRKSKIRYLFKNIIMFFFYSIFTKPRFENFKFMALGFSDGFKGNFGKYQKKKGELK
ncbi:glycosyltransferase family 2 protein [Niallia sp. 03190]|uniref:glycosyltransferase family 2 protein n=1 Tax=Niallia sp. 03190 TaxID=3458061 RepID=UPI004044F4A0